MTWPLTVFEEFFFWGDRPAYPSSCFLRLRFSGRLDPVSLEKAVAVAIERHPLLRSRVETNRRGRLQWVEEENHPIRIEWIDGPAGGPFPSPIPLDLRRGNGIRFYGVQDSENSELIVQWHHSCCDAAGIESFLCDLLRLYAMQCSGGEQCADSRQTLPTLDSSALARRGRFGLTAWKLLAMAPQLAFGLKRAWNFVRRTPVPIMPRSAPFLADRPPESYPAVLRHTFDRDETERLSDVARARGATTNDLLIRDLYLAIFAWRQREKVADESSWLRMMIPVNLRSVEDRHVSAANIVTVVFLERKDSDFDDPEKLLEGIHNEMDLIKRNRLGLIFIFALSCARRFPGGIRWHVTKQQTNTTMVYTNIGNFLSDLDLPHRDGHWVVGRNVLQGFEIVPPLQPYLDAVFSGQFYAGKLTISMHYEPRAMTEVQAESLLQRIVFQVKGSSCETSALKKS